MSFIFCRRKFFKNKDKAIDGVSGQASGVPEVFYGVESPVAIRIPVNQKKFFFSGHLFKMITQILLIECAI